MINELILAGVSFFHPHTTLDSLGTETINGKIFVIHKVDEKETLYSIARRYGASVDGIMQSNPGMTNTLEIGQILKVPYTVKSSNPTTAVAAGQTHKVAAKETMYSISKMYGVSVDDLRKWNNLTDNSISIGQELIVKKPKAGSTPVTAGQTQPKPLVTEEVKPGKTHTVVTQETLYSVARQYNVTIQQLKTWNDLTSNEVKVGQVLFVSAPGSKSETAATTTPSATTPKTTPVVTETTPKPVTQTQQTETPKVDQTASASQTKTPAQPQTIRISESVKSNDEIMETGVAELIEGTEGNRKYLALHRTAPVGTILKVKNEMNNREVFVRVMGKLQDTAQNNKLVIKLSRSAYDRLGAIDPKFRVEVTYYK